MTTLRLASFDPANYPKFHVKKDICCNVSHHRGQVSKSFPRSSHHMIIEHHEQVNLESFLLLRASESSEENPHVGWRSV